VKVAIIGCGSIGQRHARNLLDLGIRDLLLVDQQRELARSVAFALGARSVATATEAYSQSPEVAMVCAPTSYHIPLAWEALNANCHLFIEKPLSHSMKGAEELVSAAQAQNRLVLVGYNFRFDPILIRVAQWLAIGSIGHITSARFDFGSYLPGRHPGEDYRAGYGARRELGGGVVLDASHELDMALWLFGWPEEIHAIGGKYSDLETDVEDLTEILLGYGDKIVSIHLDYIARPAERRFEVIGTEGRIKADLFLRQARRFDVRENQWVEYESCGSIEETYKHEVRHLLDCIAGKSKPIIGGNSAIETLLLTERVKQSIRFGSPMCFGKSQSFGSLVAAEK